MLLDLESTTTAGCKPHMLMFAADIKAGKHTANEQVITYPFALVYVVLKRLKTEAQSLMRSIASIRGLRH